MILIFTSHPSESKWFCPSVYIILRAMQNRFPTSEESQLFLKLIHQQMTHSLSLILFFGRHENHLCNLLTINPYSCDCGNYKDWWLKGCRDSFVATKEQYRRQGMFHMLIDELEKQLTLSWVGKLVSSEDAINTWTKSFGFARMTSKNKSVYWSYLFRISEFYHVSQSTEYGLALLDVYRVAVETRQNYNIKLALPIISNA